MNTIFEQIIAGKIPCDKVFENERILAIKDIQPAAPIHILIIPKKHFRNLQEVPSEDLLILAEIFSVAQELAKQFNIEEGYRLLVNNGPTAGQTIFHLHFHLLGGRPLGKLG